MYDLGIFTTQRAVMVRSFYLATVLGGTTVRVEHDPAPSIAAVEINGERVRHVRESDRVLYADLPGSATGGIERVRVITGGAGAIGEVVGITAEVRMDAPITGESRLAQVFLSVLLTRRGSNVFMPEAGTVLPDILKGAVGLSSGILRTRAIEAINDAAVQIYRAQGGDRGVPPAERLESASLDGIEERRDGFVVRVRLRAASGIEALIRAGD